MRLISAVAVAFASETANLNLWLPTSPLASTW
nr:MAG TPA: hypothetical protein [Caudoviricetes sp.]